MKKTTLIMFFSLLILIYSFSAEDPRIKTFNDNFITIYLVGYWSRPDKDSFQKPRSDGQIGGEFKNAEIFDTIFRVRSEEPKPYHNDDGPKDYYFNESTINLQKAGYTNVFPYLFSNGWNKNNFKINETDPYYLVILSTIKNINNISAEFFLFMTVDNQIGICQFVFNKFFSP